MAGESILIVDDDPRNVEFLRDSLLDPVGYTTLCATDGEEALHLALTEEPDLILLDLQMPKMDGFEVLEALKRQGREIPAILITAHGSESIAVQAFRLGVRDYFQKPFRATEIMQAVDRSLVEARLRREKERLTEKVQQINQELQQRLEELGILYNITKSVASVLDLDSVLRRIVEATTFVTGAEEASLFLVDEQTQEVHLRAIQGSEDREVRRTKTEADDAVVRQVVTTGQVGIIKNPHPGATEPGLMTVAVPLKVREKAIGALCACRKENSGPIADNDRYLLSALADYAAIAIENARLYEATQLQLAQRKESEEAIRQLAYHDPLTGLPNRMLFDDRLGVALARARRYQQRVAVLLLDLDRFKEVNDRLGHSVGDQLLKAVGERLVAVLRASDSVCRMGGDEFLLLLTEIERVEHASRAAERILDIIREPIGLDEHSLHVTTSIGFALYPDDGQDGDTLVERADVAMYRAKDAGRDNWKRYGMDSLDDTSGLS